VEKVSQVKVLKFSAMICYHEIPEGGCFIKKRYLLRSFPDLKFKQRRVWPLVSVRLAALQHCRENERDPVMWRSAQACGVGLLYNNPFL
jgi:hypothetical protein